MRITFGLCAAAALAACTTTTDFPPEEMARNIAPVSGPAPRVNTTPMEDALACINQNLSRGRDLRIGVGDITDGTGARTLTSDNNTLLTQRPDLMFIVGLKQTGLRVLNRNAIKVSEWELAQAMEKRLGEGRSVELEGETFNYRPVEAGTMLGTTHFVTGALTEVNWNISSQGGDVNILGAYQGGRTYHISIAADIMVTDTKSTEITLARSYSKQVVGREINRGLYRFFEVSERGQIGPIELFDMNVGSQQNEPVQRAVRWLMEAAAYDIGATLTRTHDKCDPIARGQQQVARQNVTPQ